MYSRWVFASLAALALAPAKPEGVAVRWSEGSVHGFVDLRTQAGQLLSHGDVLQTPRDSDLKSELIFHFGDSSLFQETVTYTQHQTFRLESYHLIQRGKAFAQDIDATFSDDGRYVVTTTSHKDGKQQRYDGTMQLPVDVYNGMIPVIGKNVDRKVGRTVHIVAFTPKPLVIPLAFVPDETQHGVTRFTLKPKLNFLQRVGAALKKATPPDSHLWIVTEDVPAFVRFEGPLYSGPVWRIDLGVPAVSSANR